MPAIPAETGMASAVRQRQDRIRSLWADAWDGDELDAWRGKHVHQRSKSSEQCPCRRDRDSRGTRECLFRSRDPGILSRPLRVPRPIAAAQRRAAEGYSTNPMGRILGTFTPAQSHTEICDGQNEAPHRLIGQLTPIDRRPFDQKIWPFRPTTHGSDLCPQASAIHRLMKVGDSLSLDQSPVLDELVTDGKRALLDGNPESPQSRHDPRFVLVDIGNDEHIRRVPARLRRLGARMVKKASLAISQGETA